MNKKSFKNWQIRIFILCWIAYSCIYIGRNNLSVALPDIQNFLGASKSQIGLIGSLFLWIYGFGQLVNGYLGDKVSSRLYIFIGLFATALCNILFGLTSSLILMSVLWACNGFFQSMLWGPMAKTITFWVRPEKRSGAAIGISTSMVGGTLLAYLIAARVLNGLGWKWVFWIPGIFILIYSFVWLKGIRNHPKDAGFEEIAACETPSNNSAGSIEIPVAEREYTLLEIIKKTKLYFIVIACLAQGIVKDSINLWAPTFFLETHKLNLSSIASLIIAIPVMNFGGMMLAGWLNRKLKYFEKVTTIVLFLIGILMIIGLKTLGGRSALLGIVFLGLSSAMMYGANTLLLGVVPMGFARYNKVSSVAGALDFFSYIAAGFATALTGVIIDFSGWGGVLVFWIGITLLGIVSLAVMQIGELKTARAQLNS